MECTTSQGLITDIACKEWGFIGYIVTDIFDDTDLFAAVVNAGVTGYDLRGNFSEEGFPAHSNDGQPISAEMFAGDANILTKIKEAAHNTLWAFCQTNLMNAFGPETHFQQLGTWWRTTYKAVIGVTAILFVASFAAYSISIFGKKKKEEQ